MNIHEYFKTPVWVEVKKDFVKSANKASNKYIKEAKKRNKDLIKKTNDFGYSHHSTPLSNDPLFRDLLTYVGQKSWEFLDWQGFDMNQYDLLTTEMWVQEFSKNGGGHHSTHVHWNQHVSAFYFLKCSEKTSYPVLHDPRSGAMMTKLKIKPQMANAISHASNMIHYKPQPGTLIIFPGYIPHEYAVDHGKEPFRFIHFNFQAVEKIFRSNVKA